jgi:hypothetical protein
MMKLKQLLSAFSRSEEEALPKSSNVRELELERDEES